MKSIALISIFLLELGSTRSSAQNQVENGANKNWAQFSVGTSVTMKSTSKMNGKTIATVKIVSTLIKKSKQEVTIEFATIVITNGMEIKTPSEEFVLKAKVNKPDDAPDTNTKETGKGKEKLKVGDNSYDCRWVSSSNENSGVKTESKIWMSDKVPGMIVKSVTKTSSGLESISELVELKAK